MEVTGTNAKRISAVPDTVRWDLVALHSVENYFEKHCNYPFNYYTRVRNRPAYSNKPALLCETKKNRHPGVRHHLNEVISTVCN